MPKNAQRNQKFKRIVIAIIAILAGILLPALNAAREKARQISCVNNEKAIFGLITLYSFDNQEWMPPTGTTQGYAYFVLPYYKGKSSDYDLYEGSYPGRALKFHKPKGIYFCPSLPEPHASSCWTGGTNTSAFYFPMYVPTCHQDYASKRDGGWLLDGAAFRNSREIMNNSVIMGESNFASARTDIPGYNGVEYMYQGKWTDSSKMGPTSKYGPGWLHSGKSNFMRTDGSIRSIRWDGVSWYNGNFMYTR